MQLLAVLFGAVLLSAAFIALRPASVEAQAGACSTLPSDKGLATHTEAGVGSGEYTVFARVKVASGPATFDLSIDGAGGSLCDLQVSQDGSNGNWVWYSSGSNTLNWSGGDMRFQMSGDKNGVGLDCIVLFDLTQGNFNPSTKEDCNPVDDSTSETTGGTVGTSTGDSSGCTPVSGALATNAVQSFLLGTVKSGTEVFDADNNNQISGAEATNAVLKFLRGECAN